jgi:hypothetical protein
MNYLKVYCNLIRKAENRTPPEGYTEKHHIFPKSIFGDNKRVVVLTAREHYIAHALLEKIYIKRYGLKNKKTIKMITAFWCMNNQNTLNEYYNSYFYEYSKMRFIESIRGRVLTEEHKENLRKNSTGRIWWSDGTNTKHSKECPGDGWYRGRPNINIGREMSMETREKIRIKNKNKKLTEEHKEKVKSELRTRKWWNNGVEDKHTAKCPGEGWVLGRLYKRKLSEEEIENIKIRMKNRVVSEETRKKQSESKKGTRWWNNGVINKKVKECPDEGWVLGRL